MAEARPWGTVLRWTSGGLALVLVLAAFTDRNLAYAGFHASAAMDAVLAATLFRGRFAGAFLAVFGVLDLYQAVASTVHWFPEALFGYTAVDDLVHWWLGSFLVLLGCSGLWKKRRP